MEASFTVDNHNTSNHLAQKLREKLKSNYSNEILSKHENKFHVSKYYINSYLYTTLNYLLLDNTDLFEKSYNKLISIFNGYDSFSTTISYNGTKNYILKQTTLDENKRRLTILLINLVSSPRDINVVSEYNLNLPIQYRHLEKVQVP